MFRVTLLASALLLAGLSAAGAASTTTYVGGAGIPNFVLVDPATGNPFSAGAGPDPNNASYSSTTAVTAGTPFTAGRGLYANCTGSGQTTVTMKDGTTLPWSVGAGFQQQPFSATNVTAVTGCTFGVLN